MPNQYLPTRVYPVHSLGFVFVWKRGRCQAAYFVASLGENSFPSVCEGQAQFKDAI